MQTAQQWQEFFNTYEVDSFSLNVLLQEFAELENKLVADADLMIKASEAINRLVNRVQELEEQLVCEKSWAEFWRAMCMVE